MRTPFVFTLLFVSQFSYAQIPNGYYQTAEGIMGIALKNELYQIIKDQKSFHYSSSSTDTWDILKETDRDTANPKNVILFYSGRSVNAAQEYNSAKGWSREHIWDKSHGSFTTSRGPGTDLHNLRPADITINNSRGKLDFDMGGTIVIDGEDTTACRKGPFSWEPRDEVKGDVARSLFYMAVRYEGENGEPDLELVDQVNSLDLCESGIGFHGKLSTLIDWHHSDPVDSFEMRRNNIIYSYQGNRNPFIDNPEYVDQIWTKNGVRDSIHSSVLTQKQVLFRVYPNPANHYVCIELSQPGFAKGSLIALSGKTIRDFEIDGMFRLETTGLEVGMYLVRVETKNRIELSRLLVWK